MRCCSANQLLFLAICALLRAPIAAAEAPLDHANLLVYRDRAGDIRPVESREDWASRRQQILAGMQQAMGVLPDRSQLPNLDVQIVADLLTDGVRRQTISFASGDGDRVTAYLFLPPMPQPKRLPALLALHQTANVGKGDTAGLGVPESRPYGLELAQRGYIVLAPDYPSFGDAQGYDFQNDRYESGTMKGIWNHMRAVDLLVARADVDPTRLGTIGHSLGGHNSMFVGVFDERLKVIVTSCGWTPFHDYYGGKLDGWTSDRYMPRIRDVYALDPNRVPFDFYEIVAALAPRAFFSSSPVRDNNFEVSGVRKAMAAAAGIYKLFDAAENLRATYPDSAHDFPPEARREAYRFIDLHLAHQPTRDIP